VRRLLRFVSFSAAVLGALLLFAFAISQPPVPVLTNVAGALIVLALLWFGFRLYEWLTDGRVRGNDG
jgi:lipid-A-disaccharide synthase-like uncharacterized protein